MPSHMCIASTVPSAASVAMARQYSLAYPGGTGSSENARSGASVSETAVARLHTLSAGLMDSASLDHPDAITPVSRTLAYAKDLTVDLDPYTVAVVEIRAE